MLDDPTATDLLLEKIQSFLGTPMLEIIIINLAFTVIAFLYLWSRVQLKLSAQNKIDLENKKRTSFEILLDQHYNLLVEKHLRQSNEEFLKDFSKVSKGILLWGSDKVVYHYGCYCEEYLNPKEEPAEREIHFANSVLGFRKSIGKRNWWNKIKPKHIVYIFRFTYSGTI